MHAVAVVDCDIVGDAEFESDGVDDVDSEGDGEYDMVIEAALDTVIENVPDEVELMEMVALLHELTLLLKELEAVYETVGELDTLVQGDGVVLEDCELDVVNEAVTHVDAVCEFEVVKDPDGDGDGENVRLEVDDGVGLDESVPHLEFVTEGVYETETVAVDVSVVERD